MSETSNRPTVPDVAATMERLHKQRNLPVYVREFIVALGASVIVLGTRVEGLEKALREIADHEGELAGAWARIVAERALAEVRK